MLFIHIGMHKAGSSSIQAFLHENAPRLAARGVIYPAMGLNGPAHHGLGRALRDGVILEEWAEIRRLAESGTVVLSSETFCTFEPRLLAQAIGDTPVRILCWQRNAAEGVVSRYAQETRRGRNLQPFDVFFARHSDNEHLLIAPLLRRWSDPFGATSIRVRSLDAEVLEGGDLIADLLHVLGLAPDQELIDSGRRNLSPGWRALETIRRLSLDISRRGPLDPKTQRYLRRVMPPAVVAAEAALGLFERGAYLNLAQASALAEDYNADIEALGALGLDCRMRPLRLESIETAEEPLTEASMSWETRARLLQAAMVELSTADFRMPRLRPTDDDAGEAAPEPEETS
jgi:hypothetical protein